MLVFVASKIHLSGATASLLKTEPTLTISPRGEILIKVTYMYSIT
jgi:hypothetical protein